MAGIQYTDIDPDEAAQLREPFVAAPVLSAPRPVPAPPPGAGTGSEPSASRLAAMSLQTRAGASDFGPLARYVGDPAVTDVFVNGPDDLWIDRGEGLVRQGDWSCPSEAKLRELAVAIVARGGRHIDESKPYN